MENENNIFTLHFFDKALDKLEQEHKNFADFAAREMCFIKNSPLYWLAVGFSMGSKEALELVERVEEITEETGKPK